MEIAKMDTDRYHQSREGRAAVAYCGCCVVVVSGDCILGPSVDSHSRGGVSQRSRHELDDCYYLYHHHHYLVSSGTIGMLGEDESGGC